MQKVLVVEDDLDTGTTIAEILTAEGYQPIAIQAGEQAIEYLKSGEMICLMLLDLHLSGVTGVGVLRWLRKHDKLHSVRVAVMTASGARERAIAASFRDHVVRVLEKPFDVAELLEIIEEHCGPTASAA